MIVIDADLQHPVEMIHELLDGYEEGYDQVIACRNRKGDNFVKTALSKVYYKLINKVVDVQLEDGAGDFRLLSRRAVDALLILSEGNRFSKGLFSWIGFDQKWFIMKTSVAKMVNQNGPYRNLLIMELTGLYHLT